MTRPNILFITTDQLRLDSLGCYGNLVIKTPNIDRIAQQGVKFNNFFVQAPQCMTSRNCIVTGMYARGHGVRQYGQSLPGDFPNMGSELTKVGYHTAIIGKTHFYWDGEVPFEEPSYGFDTYWDRRLWEEYRKTVATEEQIKQLDYNKKIRPSTDPHPNPMPEEATCDYWTTMKSIDFLDEYQEDKPFFLWVSYVNPHPPFNPPSRFIGLYNQEDMPVPRVGENERESWQHRFKRQYWRKYDEFAAIGERGYQKIYSYYYSMVTMLDEYIGKILEALDKNGYSDNTMIVFTTDHGDMMGDHGFGLKGSCHYDQIIHVPLIWYWSGYIEEGKTIDAIVESVDLMPTFLDYAGGSIPTHVSGVRKHYGVNYGIQGQSIRPVLDGEKDEIKEFAIAECYDSCWLKTFRSKKWSMSFYPNVDGGELYDIENDPGQFNNLWFDTEYHDIKMELIQKLFNRICETEPSLL